MLRILLAALVALTVQAQTQILPLAQVRAGMRGVGRTVFAGNRVEEFQAEILGVMENTGPKQSMILARLSGGPLATTGVMQGMSGSPVYVNARLIGAVATAFSFSKEPIAGIRPIEDMLSLPATAAQRAMRWSPDGSQIAASLRPVGNGKTKLANIATPLNFTGFPSVTIDHFASQFRALGMEPRQGVAGGGNGTLTLGDTKLVTPGSMISAHLITGDMVMGADGTVTHVDGNNVYAFGHEFLQAGAVEVPFWRSEVLALLPSTEISFKISSSREFMGTLTGDYESGIRGELGRQPAMLPVRIVVDRGGAGGRQTYNLSVVRDDLLSPFFLQVATAAAIDATGRASGEATARVEGEIRFATGPPVRIRNTYAADTALSGMAALAGAIPLSYVLQSGFAELRPTAVELTIQTADRKSELTVDDLWASRAKVRPGETVEFSVELRGDGATEVVRRVRYTVPVGMPAGPLQISVHDAQTSNLLDYAQTVNQPPHSAGQAVEFLNGLRPNHQAFLRIVRPEASFPVGHRQLADPPPSIALLLNRWPASGSPALPQARVAEFAIDGPAGSSAQISGSRTIQIEVVE